LVPTISDYFGDIGTKDGSGKVDDDHLPDLVDDEAEKPKEDKPKKKEDPFKFNFEDWVSLGSEKLDRDALIHRVL